MGKRSRRRQEQRLAKNLAKTAEPQLVLPPLESDKYCMMSLQSWVEGMFRRWGRGICVWCNENLPVCYIRATFAEITDAEKKLVQDYDPNSQCVISMPIVQIPNGTPQEYFSSPFISRIAANADLDVLVRVPSSDPFMQAMVYE